MKKLKKEEFLTAITTTFGSDWKKQIREIDHLGLEKTALFLTGLLKEQRQELCCLLEKTKLKRIPLVHLRSDMEVGELDWLVRNYQTQVFVLHSFLEYPILFDYTKYQDRIYIENTRFRYFKEEAIKGWAGICLDFAHLEDYRLLNQGAFHSASGLLEKYPIGCNHISAVMPEPHLDEYGFRVYGRHHFQQLSEFDYLQNYPLFYFSRLCALELENPLSQQLEAIDYILKLGIK